MGGKSITSADSFRARAQRSESNRVVLWLVILVAALLLALARRWFGGAGMSNSRVFLPFFSVLTASIVCQVVLLLQVRRANRGGYLLPDWLWRGDAVVNLCVVMSLLMILEFLSPSGPLQALSAPTFLLLPIVGVQSVLRLRPAFTLFAGLAAATFHLLLAIRAIVVTHVPINTYSFYLSYSCMLALIAFACGFVSGEMKAHVSEAADEAAAHERAERQVVGMQRDLAVAREIQLGLLPTRPPVLAGFDIVGMNRPADQTGGDYYDWQELPGARLAVALGDVSGHGIGPALVMAVCRAYARSTAPTVPNPVALLTRLNELLHGDLPADRFITFVMAVLDEDGSARLVSAGHGPTLFFRASTGAVTQFNANGIPLGIDPVEKYGPMTLLNLDEGDVLVMLTDGFFEWRRPGDLEEFGIDRLQETLRECTHHDAQTILRTLDESVCQFCDGSPQHDDMTAIVIKRKTPAAGRLSAAA